jgi:hypothetical protein
LTGGVDAASGLACRVSAVICARCDDKNDRAVYANVFRQTRDKLSKMTCVKAVLSVFKGVIDAFWHTFLRTKMAVWGGKVHALHA